MIEKLQLLHPEIALFITTCVVMILGLSKSYTLRKSCAIVTAIGLVITAWLGAISPTAGDDAVRGALFPGLLPYAKTLIPIVGLLLLAMLSGTVDRGLEQSVSRGKIFDPIRATRGEFYAFFLFSLTGVMLCATADDLIWLFLALELTSLPTYIMVAMSSRRLRASEAGVKYFFLGAFGAAIFLYGFALIYGAFGTTNLPEIRVAIGAGPVGAVGMVGFVMAIVGIAFKIAAFPMHFYTPDVYQGAASPVSGFLAFAPKAAGFLALMMIVGTIGWSHGAGGGLPEEIRTLLWVMAALSMTVGNVLALLQTSVKRMLAYSSIAHSGYMLVGLVVGPGRSDIANNGVAAMLFYLLCYGVMNVGAFAVLASLQKRAGEDGLVEVDTLDDIRGVARQYPWLGWAMVLSIFSMIGFPPLLGFWGKLMLLTSAISGDEIALALVLAVNSAIAGWYYLRIARATWLERRPEHMDAPLLTPVVSRRVVALVSAGAVVAMVVVIAPLQRASARAGQPDARPSLVEQIDEPDVSPEIEPVAMRDSSRDEG